MRVWAVGGGWLTWGTRGLLEFWLLELLFSGSPLSSDPASLKLFHSPCLPTSCLEALAWSVY